MSAPHIIIAEDIRTCTKECRLGWLVYTADVQEDCPQVWQAAEKLLPGMKARLEATPLADMPRIGDSRRGLKDCGKDPGRWRISSEALYRRIRQGKDLYRINSVVDVNNLVSLESGFSLGSYDMARLHGVLTLRRGRPGETYPGIGKDAVDLENMPLLADEEGPVGSPVSDSTRAMIRPESRHILTLIYSFSPCAELKAVLETASGLFVELGGAQELSAGIIE